MKLIEKGCADGLKTQEACEAVGITDRTYRNWKRLGEEDGRMKRTAFSSARKIEETTRNAIIERFCREDVSDLSLSQAFYKLLDEKQEYHCSLSTLYRLFAAKGLNKRRAPMRDARHRYKPTSYLATAPNRVWTWDITYFRTSRYTGRFYYAYVIIDVYSRYIISARVYEADNAEYAKAFLSDAFKAQGVHPGTLVVHSDNGASMKAASTQALLKDCGVQFSHSRPRVSNDNPYSESFFRTLKYSGDYLYPTYGFESLEEAQKWLTGFVTHYNEEHRHSGIRMVTPGARFRHEDKAILRRRERVIQKARREHPERWIQGKTLCCAPVGAVWLNPENGLLQEKPPQGANQRGGDAKSPLHRDTESDRSYPCTKSISGNGVSRSTKADLFAGKENRGVKRAEQARGSAP